MACDYKHFKNNPYFFSFCRHDLVLYSRDRSLTSKLQSLANLTFLKESYFDPKTNKNENIDIALTNIAQVAVNENEIYKDKLQDLRERYAKYVLVPEGIEHFLRDKYKWSKEKAHEEFLKFKAKPEEEIDEDDSNEKKPNIPQCNNIEENPNTSQCNNLEETLDDGIPDFDNDDSD